MIKPEARKVQNVVSLSDSDSFVPTVKETLSAVGTNAESFSNDHVMSITELTGLPLFYTNFHSLLRFEIATSVIIVD